MPKKAPSASSTNPNPAHRLWGEMAAHLGPHDMPGFLSRFVESCDIDVLRIALDSGLIGADKNNLALLSCIMPLVQRAPESEKERAQAFVAEWRSRFEPFDHDKLDIQLATASEGTSRFLISLGANPNGFGSSNRNITALGRTHGIRHYKSALVMLKELAARDEVPMQAYNVVPDASTSTSNVRFAAVTESATQDISYFYGLMARVGSNPSSAGNVQIKELKQHVDDIFQTIDIPPSWRKDLARSLVKTAEAKGLWKTGQRAEIFGELIREAEFGSAIQFRHVVAFFAEDLRRENCVEIVAALAKKLVDMGMHPDQIFVRPPSDVRPPQTMTWLQSAAYHNQSDMVMALLEAGADPNLRSCNDTGMNAHDFAEYQPETRAVLTTWKAKSAVDAVIRNTVAGAGKSLASRQP